MADLTAEVLEQAVVAAAEGVCKTRDATTEGGRNLIFDPNARKSLIPV